MGNLWTTLIVCVLAIAIDASTSLIGIKPRISKSLVGISPGNRDAIKDRGGSDVSGDIVAYVVASIENKDIVAVVAVDVVGVFGDAVGVGVVGAFKIAGEDGDVFGQVAVIELIEYVIDFTERFGTVPAAVDLEAVLIAGHLERSRARIARFELTRWGVDIGCNDDHIIAGGAVEGLFEIGEGIIE